MRTVPLTARSEGEGTRIAIQEWTSGLRRLTVSGDAPTALTFLHLARNAELSVTIDGIEATRTTDGMGGLVVQVPAGDEVPVVVGLLR